MVNGQRFSQNTANCYFKVPILTFALNGLMDFSQHLVFSFICSLNVCVCVMVSGKYCLKWQQECITRLKLGVFTPDNTPLLRF